MRFLSKIFGFKPRVGSKVSGYLDYGIKYEGTVVETHYSEDGALFGAYVLGKITVLSPWRTVKDEEDHTFFVPYSKL